MPKPNLSFNPDPTQFAKHVASLRTSLKDSNPQLLASNTGSVYQQLNGDHGVFHLFVWDQSFDLSYPEFIARDLRTGQELPLITQALVLYYFSIADGTIPEQGWIAFSELPDGRFYNQAFQGYTGRELEHTFHNDFQEFERVALVLGGIAMKSSPNMPGDCAFAVQALPRVPLLVAAWQGDEDFPSSFQILFDASVSHYLSTDSCAILGSMLTRKLISKKNQL